MVNGRDMGKLEEGRNRALGGRSSLAQGWDWGKEFFGKDILITYNLQHIPKPTVLMQCRTIKRLKKLEEVLCCAQLHT